MLGWIDVIILCLLPGRLLYFYRLTCIREQLPLYCEGKLTTNYPVVQAIPLLFLRYLFIVLVHIGDVSLQFLFSTGIRVYTID